MKAIPQTAREVEVGSWEALLTQTPTHLYEPVETALANCSLL